jgi:hypothetical protein
MPESVITWSIEGPTAKCMCVITDLLVVVGFEPRIQPVEPSDGPKLGGSVIQVLPQCASVTTVSENERESVNRKWRAASSLTSVPLASPFLATIVSSGRAKTVQGPFITFLLSVLVDCGGKEHWFANH